jgi:hypothetical protein
MNQQLLFLKEENSKLKEMVRVGGAEESQKLKEENMVMRREL